MNTEARGFFTAGSSHGYRIKSVMTLVSGRLEGLFEAERDQLPLWLPVGLGLGIAAWFALPDSSAWIAFLLGAGACFFGFLPQPERAGDGPWRSSL